MQFLFYCDNRPGFWTLPYEHSLSIMLSVQRLVRLIVLHVLIKLGHSASPTSEGELLRPLTNNNTPHSQAREMQILSDNDRYSLCPIERWGKTKYPIERVSTFYDVSYMEFSQQTTLEDHPILWIGSDGKRNGICAVDLITGTIIQTFRFEGIDKEGDYEAMALGPCTSDPYDDAICIYLGDVGNNIAGWCEDQSCEYGRDKVKVYKFVEPDLSALSGGDNGGETNIAVSTLILDYHHGDLPTNRADCESLFVDYTGDDVGGCKGDIYLVTKFPYQEYLERLVKVPAHVHEELRPSDEIQFSVLPVGTPWGDSLLWTSGAMPLDGTLIALRDYYRIYFFPRSGNVTVSEALEQPPCEFTSNTIFGDKEEIWFETVTFFGRDLIAEAPECTRPNKGCNVSVTVYGLTYDTLAAFDKTDKDDESSNMNDVGVS